MVSSSRSNNRLVIIARPNQSQSWRANLYVLLALSVPCLGAGIGFTLLGAWPILPLAGLEMLALGSALYFVQWKLQYRQVITFSADKVQIEKGYYYPRRSWLFPRKSTGLAVESERHPWDGPSLALHDAEQQVRIGEFLSREDAMALLELLRGELRINSHAPSQSRSF
ncbi:DUF2244 domain-containing protein [Haliea sp. E17]|uniref:DUF2244 domain-containing protein n=1 Tax=Haliea sp. E17 TaxID=3401576 RepID=UPI003AAF3C9B